MCFISCLWKEIVLLVAFFCECSFLTWATRQTWMSYPVWFLLILWASHKRLHKEKVSAINMPVLPDFRLWLSINSKLPCNYSLWSFSSVSKIVLYILNVSGNLQCWSFLFCEYMVWRSVSWFFRDTCMASLHLIFYVFNTPSLLHVNLWMLVWQIINSLLNCFMLR